MRQVVGIVRPVAVDLFRDGLRVSMDGQRDLWVLEIVSEGARATRVQVADLMLPEGATLFIAGEGANAEAEYPASTLVPKNSIWTPIVAGDTLRLELMLPEGAEGGVHVSGLGHVFAAGSEAQVQGCHLDVSCYPEWKQGSDSVARIVFNDQQFVYACSAVLLNNNSGDYAPLLLTAHHCLDTVEMAQTLIAFFFNRSMSCNSDIILFGSTTNGAALLATSADSDVSLLELLGAVPNGAVFAGWTTNTPAVGDTIATIHHPGNFQQKISFGSIQADLPGTPAFHHVIYSAGTGEPGSSGAPLFNANRQVMGQLYGGNASCTNPSGDVLYGKMSASYPHLSLASGWNFLEQGIPDDRFAPNQSPAAAVTLTPGVLETGLILKAGKDDWFKMEVPADRLIRATGSMPGIQAFDDTGGALTPVSFNQWYFYNQGMPRLYKFKTTVGFERLVHYQLKIDLIPPVLPFIQATSASAYGVETMRLDGTINGKSFPFSSWFEWSTNSDFSGSQSSPPWQFNLYSDGAISRAEFVNPVKPETKYYVRQLANNVAGTAVSATVEVTTSALPVPSILVPQNGQENVATSFSAMYCCEARSWGLYLGTAPDPPLVAEPWDGRMTLAAGTRYYMRAKANYAYGSKTSSEISFATRPNIRFAYPSQTQQFFGPLSFGDVVRGREGASRSVYISNNTAGPLPIAISATGDFQQSNSCPGILMNDGSSCEIKVTFAPSVGGFREGLLSVNHGAETARLSLSGNAIDLLLSLSRPARTGRSVPGGVTELLLSSYSNEEVEAQLSCEGSALISCSVDPAIVRLKGESRVIRVLTFATRRSQRLAAAKLNGSVRVRATMGAVSTTLDVPVTGAR